MYPDAAACDAAACDGPAQFTKGSDSDALRINGRAMCERVAELVLVDARPFQTSWMVSVQGRLA